jgi:hypothetical protein
MAENTLNYVDLDDSIAVQGAERLFDIKFGNNELSNIYNVGQFYDLIQGKRHAIHPRTQACLTQTAFYRFRREIVGRSFPELRHQKGGSSPSDVWDALAAMLRDVNSHKRPIDRETTFFAKT